MSQALFIMHLFVYLTSSFLVPNMCSEYPKFDTAVPYTFDQLFACSPLLSSSLMAYTLHFRPVIQALES